jgi:succinyl-CoA synthetase beta subunit
VRALASDLGLARAHWEPFTKTLQGLLQCYIDSDAEFLQIARLGLTASDEYIAIEATMRVDRNAIHRQGNLFALSAAQQIDPIQIQAQKANLSYISVTPTGAVNCIANGSGLCMALLDEVYTQTAIEPAVFIDMGDIIKLDRLRIAFRLALSNPAPFNLVALCSSNQDCQEIVRVILAACEGLPPEKHVVLQMRGVNAQQAANDVHAADQMNLTTATTIRGAVQKIAELKNGH